MPAKESSIPRSERIRLIVGLIGLGLNGGLSLNIVPLMSGALIDELALSSTAVGTVLSVQGLIAAVVGIVLSSRMYTVAPRPAGVAAAGGVFAATLAFASVDSPWALFGAAAVMGISLGVLGVCGAAAIGLAEKVDRTAAIVAVGISLAATVLTVPLAHAVGAGGRRALFSVDLAIVAGSMMLVAALPARRATSARNQSVPFLSTLAMPIVFVSVCLSVGTNGLWAFCERIGVALGFTNKQVGEILAGSTMIAMFGGIAAMLAARPGFERMWAMVGVVVYGITSAAIAFAPDQTSFVVTICAQAFAFVFMTPFLVAVAIGQDRSGGLVAAAAGWSALLGAGAPAVAGWMIEDGGYASLGWLALVSTAGAAFALISVGRQRGLVRSLAP